MATIYDIAEFSKTSAATVSYVLNGRGNEKRISKATQDRILDVANRLNYHPNIYARQLNSTGKAIIRIAVLWPEFYFEQPMICVMRAIRDLIKFSGEEVEVSMHFFTPNALKEKGSKLSPANYNGILLAGASLEDLDYIAGLQNTVPIVLINRQKDNLPSASVDHEAAGRMACELAYKYSPDSFCSIWDTRYHVATNLRRTAFNRRGAELSINVEKDQYNCEGTAEAGYELGMSLVRRQLLKHFVYCNNDSIARGVLSAISNTGMKIGQDVLLLTANSGPDSSCRFTTPPLSSIDLCLQEVMVMGFQLCLKLISRNDVSDNNIIIPPKCILRDSLPEF